MALADSSNPFGPSSPLNPDNYDTLIHSAPKPLGQPIPTISAEIHDVRPIPVVNPIALHEYPDQPQAQAAYLSTMHSLRFLEQGFRTAASPAGPTRDMWLRVVSETLAYIHNSIQTTHAASTLPVAFDSLSVEERSSFDLVIHTLSSLYAFFDNYCTSPEHADLCLRCLYEGDAPMTEPAYESVMLSCHQNASAAYATITNDLVRDIHADLTKWAKDVQDLVKDSMIQALTNDSFDLSLIDAHDDIRAWLSNVWDSARNSLKDRAEAQAREEAEAFFKQRSDELAAQAEDEFNKFKQELRIKTELRKDNAVKAAEAAVRASSRNHPRAPPIKTANSGRVTRSQSRSMRGTPNPSRPASPARPMSTTPKASPAVMGPPGHALTEPLTHAPRALSEPRTDVSVGPPENSLEEAMLGIHTVAHSIHAPMPLVAQPSAVPAPTAADPEPSLLSQIALLIDSKLAPVTRSLDTVNTRLDEFEEQRRRDVAWGDHPYSPSAPAQAWLKPEAAKYDDANAGYSLEEAETFDREMRHSRLVEEHASRDASWAMFLRVQSLPTDTPRPPSVEDTTHPHAAEFSRFLSVNEEVAARTELERDELPLDFFFSEEYLTIVRREWLTWGHSAASKPDLEPLPTPSSSSLPFKHPKATTLGCGLDLASPPSPPPTTSRPAAPSQARATAPRRAPSPDGWVQVTKGKATSYAKVAAQTAAAPAPAALPPSANGHLTKAQISALTRAQIMAIITDKYNGKVNLRSNKGALVTFLLSLQARANPIDLTSTQGSTPPPSHSVPPAQPGPPAASTRPRARPANQAALYNTEFTVQVGADSVAVRRPKEKAEDIVRSLRTAMNQQHAGGPALVTLLSGRWSSQLSHNFVLVFAGQPTNDQVYKYRAVLTAPFGPGAHLVPQKGYVHMQLHGIPLVRGSNGRPVPSSALMSEIKRNPVCNDILFVNAPTWVIRNDSPSKTHASVTFAMIDEDGSITQRLIRYPPSLFGATATARKRVPLPLITQCARCHMLGHSVNRCKITRGVIICPLCGKDHRARDHHVKCAKAPHHGSITCNCPPSCINCARAGKSPKGHTALDTSCPLRKAFKTPTTRTGDSSGEEEADVNRDVDTFKNRPSGPIAPIANPAAEKAQVDDEDVPMLNTGVPATNPFTTSMADFTASTGIRQDHPSFAQLFIAHMTASSAALTSNSDSIPNV